MMHNGIITKTESIEVERMKLELIRVQDSNYKKTYELYMSFKEREGPGHIGYCISNKYRGKNYATKGLKLTLEKAREFNIKEAYLAVNKDNPASLKVQLKNGAYIHHENKSEYFTRIKIQ